MILKLDSAIKSEPWYPSSRIFTELEARIDLLLSDPLVDITQKPNKLNLATRWNWTAAQVETFLKTIDQEKFLQRDWYLEDSLKQQRAKAQEVIDLFNSVFDRRIQLDSARMRMINARIKEGKKLKPPIGIDQFRAVFEFKKKEWTGTEHAKYLTIKTLCAPSHFLDYLEAARQDYINSKKKKQTQTEGEKITGVLFK